MLEIQGVIIRRNCMGKKLSFADILCDLQPSPPSSSTTSSLLHHSVQHDNHNTGVAPPSSKLASEKDCNNSCGSKDRSLTSQSLTSQSLTNRIVKVIFKRPSSSWNEESSPSPFPIKTSDLPYGAQVWLTLQPHLHQEEQEENVPTITEEQNNAQDETSAEVLYEVVSWKLLQDPKQDAEAMARVAVNDNIAGTTSIDNGNPTKCSTSEGDGAGMLYSTYLRERGNQFAFASSNNPKSKQQQQVIENDSRMDAGTETHKKRPRPEKNRHDIRTTKATPPFTTKPTPPFTTKTTPSFTGNCISNDSDNNNDDLWEEGHGDKVAKAKRAKLFAEWLIETFGTTYLQKGCGVLDIAGGKGHLSIELAVQGQIPCTVVDPMIRKQSPQQFVKRRDAKRIRKAQGPMPRHLATYFNQTEFVERHGRRCVGTTQADGEEHIDSRNENGRQSEKYNSRNNEHNNSEDENDCYLLDNCSCLVGLHPDQSTQDILELALRFHKSVAIVPCCVFPSFFPGRQLQDGTQVVTHAQFCQYLLQLDPTLQKAVLPFQGRNIVIYRCLDEGSKKLVKNENCGGLQSQFNH